MKNEKLDKLANLRKLANTQDETPAINDRLISDIDDRIEMTSIALKKSDREHLKTLTLFFVENGINNVATSSIVRTSLRMTVDALTSQNGKIMETYQAISGLDRRRKPKTIN